LCGKENPMNDNTPNIKAAVEALLFVAEAPLSTARIAEAAGKPVAEVRRIITELTEEYRRDERGFRIEEIAGGYQMLTDPKYVDYIKTLHRTTEISKLTPAMLETLAIVAYRQPILRADIEAIRGVQVGPILRSLMEKGLARIAGRANTIGKPFLYGTTRKFLEHFGLKCIEDLPKAEELNPPEA